MADTVRAPLADVLSADRWQIELLTGLDLAPPTGALVVAT